MKIFTVLCAAILLLTAGCSAKNESAEVREDKSCCSENTGDAVTCEDTSACNEKANIGFVSNTRTNPTVTFVELGSVNCIPCKQMQPVMEAIEEKYGSQVEVVFYDVWKEDQKKFAEEYGIKLIPTQVFLDEDGNEFHRHEGFYPEAEIDKVLQAKGLKPADTNG